MRSRTRWFDRSIVEHVVYDPIYCCPPPLATRSGLAGTWIGDVLRASVRETIRPWASQYMESLHEEFRER